MLVAALVAFQLGINYHLDYELDHVLKFYRAGKEVVESGTVTHELGIRIGQDRYLYTYKKLDGKCMLVLIADRTKKEYRTVLSIEGKKVQDDDTKQIYDDTLEVTAHVPPSEGELVTGDVVRKTLAGVPCVREERIYNDISGQALRWVAWYPVDEKKRKRVGWLEMEEYKKSNRGGPFELTYHGLTTRIRFGLLMPAEGG